MKRDEEGIQEGCRVDEGGMKKRGWRRGNEEGIKRAKKNTFLGTGVSLRFKSSSLRAKTSSVIASALKPIWFIRRLRASGSNKICMRFHSCCSSASVHDLILDSQNCFNVFCREGVSRLWYIHLDNPKIRTNFNSCPDWKSCCSFASVRDSQDSISDLHGDGRYTNYFMLQA